MLVKYLEDAAGSKAAGSRDRRSQKSSRPHWREGDSTQSIASRAGPKGLERMGNQYQYTQNDQKTDNIRQHQQFSRARPIERARARTVKTNPVTRQNCERPDDFQQHLAFQIPRLWCHLSSASGTRAYDHSGSCSGRDPGPCFGRCLVGCHHLRGKPVRPARGLACDSDDLVPI